jgi:hypothetical protein
MQKTCNNCGTEKYGNSQVVFTEYAYEAHEARQEREKKRLWIVILVLIAALIATNIAWIIYECSFEDVITTEEIIVNSEDNGNANYIGQDGNIYYGENYDQEKNQNP